MNKIFEVIMLLCFGLAWPFSIAKSYKSRTAKGKSLFFLIVLLLGYISGIINKLVNTADYVIVFYTINLVLVATDICLYIRNSRLDRESAHLPEEISL
ncbi:MAG TPA: hypothetical protein GXZ29_05915 [Clostridiales bacterium]|nr:hypothetical protein [Clostridiales bacterium]